VDCRPLRPASSILVHFRLQTPPNRNHMPKPPSRIYLITHGDDEWGATHPTPPRPEILREGDRVTEYAAVRSQAIKEVIVTTNVSYEDAATDAVAAAILDEAKNP
jgi:hypothetical protein